MKLNKSAIAVAVGIFAGCFAVSAQAAHPMFDKVVARYDHNISWEQARENVLAPKEFFVAEKDDKYCLLDRNGQVILPAEYDKIVKFNEKSIFLKKDGKDGLADFYGNIILPVEYDEIKPFQEGLILVEKDGKRGIAESDGSVTVPVEYDKIYLQNNKFYVKKNKRHGILARDGHTLWPCNYFKAADNGNGGYIIGSENAYAYYNEQGGQITAAEFSEAKPFHEGLAAVKKDDLFGYINEQGEMVIEPQFTEAWNFREGAAFVKQGEDRYFINTDGEKLFGAPEGKYIFGYREGSAVFKDDGSFKFIDHQGQELFAIKAATYFKRPDGLIAITRTRHNISLGGFLQSAFTMLAGIPTIPGVGKGLYDTNIKLGYTDAMGNELIHTTNDFNSHIVDNRVITIIDDKTGILNLDGSFYIPARYDDLSDLDWDGNKVAVFREDDRFGFYKAGEGVLHEGYLHAENFSNGLAPVQLTESRWNYVDLKGQYLSDTKYWSYTTPFYGNAAITKNLDGRYEIINKKGETVALLSKSIQEVSPLYPDTAIVKANDKYGVIDAEGRYFIRPEYDSIRYLQQ